MRILRTVLYLLVALGAAFAAVLFTGVVEVRDVDTTGVPEEYAQRTEAVVHDWLDGRVLLLHRGSLSPLVTSSALAAMIAQALPELSDIVVEVDAPHSIVVSATQRLPDGIWCRGEACVFWDRAGTFWGSAVPSIGPLLMLVRDDRTVEEERDELFAGILVALDGLGPLGLSAKYVVIPDAEPGGIRIPTNRGWDLLMDTAGNLEDQLKTLDILLADRASDGSFHPIYVDLRTPGKVYYR